MRGRKPRPKGAAAAGGGVPAPPAELGEEARLEWRRVAVLLRRQGVLQTVDRAALAAYCQAYGRWRQAERGLLKMAALDPVTSGLMIKTSNGNAIQNPLVGIANQAMAAMVRYAAEFGMTPSARGRAAASSAAGESELTTPVLGKKEQAARAAATAGLGTDWGDDLAVAVIN